jgi:tRNA(adenine34) deaminase
MNMNDEYFMHQAIKQANIAFDEDEVPIGAVVVINNKVIAKGYNQVEKLNDATAHAEIIALTLYVTVEPCLMCCGALYWSKLTRIVYGASDVKSGALRFFTDQDGLIKPELWPFHPKAELVKGICENECSSLMKLFFKNKR